MGAAVEEKDFNLTEVFADEEAALRFLEAKRWPNGAICPRCHSKEVYKITPKPGSEGWLGGHKCKHCGKKFTAKTGTMFAGSQIPLCKWLKTTSLVLSSKKGGSPRQIEREVGVTYSAAWAMCRKIRGVMGINPLKTMLGG